MSKEEPAYAGYRISRFMLEVPKQARKNFLPNFLHHICCGTSAYAFGNSSIDIFRDPKLYNYIHMYIYAMDEITQYSRTLNVFQPFVTLVDAHCYVDTILNLDHLFLA